MRDLSIVDVTHFSHFPPGGWTGRARVRVNDYSVGMTQTFEFMLPVVNGLLQVAFRPPTNREFILMLGELVVSLRDRWLPTVVLSPPEADEL